MSMRTNVTKFATCGSFGYSENILLWKLILCIVVKGKSTHMVELSKKVSFYSPTEVLD